MPSRPVVVPYRRQSASPTSRLPLRCGVFWKPTETPCARSHRLPRAMGSSANTAPIAASVSPRCVASIAHGAFCVDIQRAPTIKRMPLR